MTLFSFETSAIDQGSRASSIISELEFITEHSQFRVSSRLAEEKIETGYEQNANDLPDRLFRRSCGSSDSTGKGGVSLSQPGTSSNLACL